MARGACFVARLVLVLLVLAALARDARAEPSAEDKALATTLFNEGKALLGSGKIAEACRKLEESQRLDSLPGTLLNLAACHESEGRLASAFAEFGDARVLAEKDQRSDRVAFAAERLAAIAPRLAKIIIVVGPEIDRPELRITRDGTSLGRAAWGTPIPVDPGDHVIEATLAKKKPWRATVTIAAEAEVKNVIVGPLEDDDTLPVAPLTASPSADQRAEHRDDRPSGLSTRRTVALVSAGVGVAALGLGSWFGIRAIDMHDDPGAKCTTTPCSQASLSINDDAKAAADASTALIVTSIVALGVAAYFWFTR